MLKSTCTDLLGPLCGVALLWHLVLHLNADRPLRHVDLRLAVDVLSTVKHRLRAEQAGLLLGRLFDDPVVAVVE